jgi:hypothetical protein
MRPAARPMSLGPALALAAVVLPLVTADARADARQASLGVRVQVLDICAANSALGPVAAALAASCLSAGATVALEQPAAPDGTGAPIRSERGPAEGNVSYVTVIY